MPCRDTGLPRDTRNFTVLQETFLNDHLLKKDDPPLILHQFKEFGIFFLLKN